jgi:hypothetical protein
MKWINLKSVLIYFVSALETNNFNKTIDQNGKKDYIWFFTIDKVLRNFN